MSQVVPVIRLFTLVPKPCGHVHGSLRATLRCLHRNGDPGFEVEEIET